MFNFWHKYVTLDYRQHKLKSLLNCHFCHGFGSLIKMNTKGHFKFENHEHKYFNIPKYKYYPNSLINLLIINGIFLLRSPILVNQMHHELVHMNWIVA